MCITEVFSAVLYMFSVFLTFILLLTVHCINVQFLYAHHFNVRLLNVCDSCQEDTSNTDRLFTRIHVTYFYINQN